MLNELKFNGLAAVVTGAAAGIGRASAEALGELGAVVYAVDNNEDELAVLEKDMTAAGAACRPIVADATQEESATAVYDRVAADGATLKSLVNTVGTNIPMPVTELSLENWNFIVSMNLTSTFLFARAMIPALLEAPNGGTIVNVSSGYGLIGGPRSPVYSATKAGVIGFTRQISVDYSEVGLRANVVCPGLTLSPRIRKFIDEGKIDPVNTLPRVLHRRAAEPSEIGNVIAFLASDAASYMTGSVVAVDGGQTAAG